MSAQSAMSDSRRYRGASGADRRAARRLSLVAAGLDMFGTKGIAGTRVDDVCAKAGLTKRYFYESFESLDALLEAVLTDVMSGLAASVTPVIAAHGWHDPAPIFEAALRPLLADPRLVQLLVVESSSGALVERRHEFAELVVDLWLTSDPHADKSPDYLASQRLLAHAMAGATAEVAFAWVSGRIEMSVDDVIVQLIRIFNRITPRV
ncbi:MAG TPA: TetR/AcrR family transcriptional regulator [Marmoricola sp.]|nr:TetR/AcrR family transcriptional regulator [Marmoricola sp.]